MFDRPHGNTTHVGVQHEFREDIQTVHQNVMCAIGVNTRYARVPKIPVSSQCCHCDLGIGGRPEKWGKEDTAEMGLGRAEWRKG